MTIYDEINRAFRNMDLKKRKEEAEKKLAEYDRQERAALPRVYEVYDSKGRLIKRTEGGAF